MTDPSAITLQIIKYWRLCWVSNLRRCTRCRMLHCQTMSTNWWRLCPIWQTENSWQRSDGPNKFQVCDLLFKLYCIFILSLSVVKCWTLCRESPLVLFWRLGTCVLLWCPSSLNCTNEYLFTSAVVKMWVNSLRTVFLQRYWMLPREVELLE